MKRLLLFLLLFFPVVAFAQCGNTSYGLGVTCITAAGASSGATGTTSESVSLSPTAGHGVIISAELCYNSTCNANGTQVFTTPSTNINNPDNCFATGPSGQFNLKIPPTSTQQFIGKQAWFCPSIESGVTTFTVHTNATVWFLVIVASEWTGLATSSAIDVDGSSVSTSANTTMALSTSTATNFTNELIYSFSDEFGDEVATPVAPAKQVNQFFNGNIAMAQTVATTGVQTNSATFSPADFWMGNVLAIKTPSSSSGGGGGGGLGTACGSTPQWTGVLANSRAINWSCAGLSTSNWPVAGEVAPVNPWTPPVRTQCGSTIAAGATAATINSAITACTAGQYVLLGPGNFTPGGVINNNKSGVTLRGSGADQTFVNIGANSISMTGSTVETNVTWTAGFTKGTTSITIGTNVGVGSIVRLTALDSTIDSGGPRYCSDTPACALNGGNDSIYQVVHVTAISGAGPFTATISPALDFDFTGGELTSQSAVWFNPSVFGIGLEDMSISYNGTSGTIVDFRYGHDNWIKGCRMLGNPFNNGAITMTKGVNRLLMNNYLYGNIPAATNAISIITDTSSDDLLLNNIVDGAYGIYNQGSSTGVVMAYNLSHNQAGSSIASGGQQFPNSIITNHGLGNMFLLEGNIFNSWQDDMIHGSHNFNTTFRNLIWGDPPNVNVNSPAPLSLEGYTRFSNTVGNVLAFGNPGHASAYKATPGSNNGGAQIGSGVKPGFDRHNCDGRTTTTSGGASACNGVDWIADSTNMFWGNYDDFTGAVRWCGTGVTSPAFSGSPCLGVSEVPSALTVTNGFQQALSGSGVGPYTATLSHTPLVCGSELIWSGVANSATAIPVAVDLAGNGTLSNGHAVSSGTVNCTTGATTVTFTSAPTGTQVINYLQSTATASPFQNPVPTTTPNSTTLTPTFFLPVTSHLSSGGTGLSWWKVCTNYPTCTTSVIPPYPPIGPDVSGGNMPSSLGYPNIAGHANQIPAWVAYQNLPIDSSLQTAFTITAWQFSSSGGPIGPCQAESVSYVCLTVSGLSSTFATVGEFQIKGATGCANFTNSVLKSNATSIAYPASSNPGCSGGTFNWPDVRQFNENVYQLDPSSGSSPTGTISPTSLSFGAQLVGTTSTAQTFTFTNNGPGNLTISTITISGDFAQTNNCPFSPAMTPGQSCTFNVTFSPTALGSRNGTITITSNASNSPSIETLNGTGVTTLTIINGTIQINGVSILN